MALPDSTIARWVPVAACVVASALAAGVLHGVPARPDAWLVVPIAWVWGVVALIGAWSLRNRVAVPWLVVGVGALIRLPLVGTPPLLSDDLFRFLWEGAVLNAGHNPFVVAPAALDGLDDALRAQVNHPELSSIYPPLALWWFRLLDVLGGQVWLIQGGTAALDLVVAGGIAVWLRDRDGPGWPAWLYALHPLPALESAVGAHLETGAIALTVLALVAWQRRRPLGAVALGVAGVAFKLFPVLLLGPLVFRRAPDGDPVTARELGLRTAAVTGAVAVALLLSVPVAAAGPELFSSFRAYSAHWSFNGLAHPLVAPWLGESTRVLLGGTGAVAVFGAWWWRRDPAAVWLVAGAAFVMLSPTVHPWYLLWVLVPSLLCARWGWAIASVAMLGSYAVLRSLDPATGVWSVPAWLPWVTWGPALVAVVGEQLHLRVR